MTPQTDEQIKTIAANAEVLKKLSDSQIIMLVLYEIVMQSKDIPPGKKFPMLSELERRAGAR